MSPGVFFLVLTAAFTHASWNFIARKVSGNLLVLWAGMSLAWLASVPIVTVLVMRHGWAGVCPAEGVRWIVATGVVHAAYLVLLGLAYERGEISLVYPIARGSGIAVTSLLGWLVLKESLSWIGGAGIALTCTGIVVISVPTRRTKGQGRAVLTALCVGVTIVGYTLVDKLGVARSSLEPGAEAGGVNPFVYISFMYLIMTGLATPFVLLRNRGRFRSTIKANIGYSCLIGLGAMGTYIMILFAYRYCPLGYVVALRETSVIIGALAGVLFLKERMTPAKAVAIFLVVIGAYCIKAG